MRGARFHGFHGGLGEAGLPVPLPVPFSVEALCAAAGERSGRSVRLLPVPRLPPGCLGAWVSARQAEWICYLGTLPGACRDHVAVHHVCHLLLGHRSRPASGLAAAVAPAVSRRLAGLMLGGDGGAGAPYAPYADEEEAAAEAMACLILARAGCGPAPDWPAAGAGRPCTPRHLPDPVLADRAPGAHGAAAGQGRPS